MKNVMVGVRPRGSLARVVVAIAVSLSVPAFAASPPELVAQSAMPPPPPPPPPAPLPPPSTAEAMPPAAISTPPPAEPGPEASPDYRKINTGVALRVGGRLQGTDTSKLNDFSIDELTLELRFSGALMPMFSWQANLNAAFPDPTITNTGGRPPVNVMDLIGKFEPIDELHVWVGRMLVASDRSNFSGPWFMSPWNFPGFYPGISAGPVGPVQGLFGRNDGVTVWGDIMKGKFKYFVGAFALDNKAASPLFSSRFNLCLIGSEPGFYHSSTYYGAQDIVAVSAGGQYQKNGFGPGQNLSIFYADALAEKNLGAGVGTLEGQYYHYSTGYQNGINNAFFILGSFLINEKIGIGKIQPLVRWQQTSSPDPLPSWKLLDVFATYVINDYFLRIAVGYQRADSGGGTTAANAVQIGLQMQR
jgi:hypothetical protein